MKRILLVIFCSILAIGYLHSQEKPLVAVIPFSATGVSENDAKVVTLLLETELVKTGAFTVIEQTEMDSILEAQEASLLGCTDETCAVELGKLLSAEQIVLGNYSTIGGQYVINAKLIDVQTGVHIYADSIIFSRMKDLKKQITKLSDILADKALTRVDERMANSNEADASEQSVNIVEATPAEESAESEEILADAEPAPADEQEQVVTSIPMGAISEKEQELNGLTLYLEQYPAKVKKRKNAGLILLGSAGAGALLCGLSYFLADSALDKYNAATDTTEATQQRFAVEFWQAMVYTGGVVAGGGLVSGIILSTLPDKSDEIKAEIKQLESDIALLKAAEIAQNTLAQESN